MCWSIRSVFDTLDGIDTMTDDIQSLMPDMDHLDTLMPQLVALMPAMIETMKAMKTMMLTMYSTQKGLQDQQNEAQENSTAMGKAFDASKNDDSFYLPPGNLQQRRVQARHEELHLPRRPCRALHHQP